MLEYINHITLNTGHSRRTYPHEIDKGLYFKLKKLLRDSFSPEGAKLDDIYYFKSSTGGGQEMITTLYGFSQEKPIPILTTGISAKTNGYLWGLLHGDDSFGLVTNKDALPSVPYIADRLEIGSMFLPEALQWTGDFSRCIGWTFLEPRAIR